METTGFRDEPIKGRRIISIDGIGGLLSSPRTSVIKTREAGANHLAAMAAQPAFGIGHSIVGGMHVRRISLLEQQMAEQGKAISDLQRQAAMQKQVILQMLKMILVMKQQLQASKTQQKHAQKALGGILLQVMVMRGTHKQNTTPIARTIRSKLIQMALMMGLSHVLLSLFNVYMLVDAGTWVTLAAFMPRQSRAKATSVMKIALLVGTAAMGTVLAAQVQQQVAQKSAALHSVSALRFW